ncbi:O-antigen ligase family protein [Dyella silvatica]|uniref:O-antigen ligase family protein n=1 Tax=Dyella silvatica TaxID=2992128 RepID=UPI0022519487|nr:O-antigen ligase family protein [Dyella silvatica]
MSTAQVDHTSYRWLRNLLGLGIAWLIIAMAVVPAGVSYNPSRLHQYSLGLTIYLPALVLLVIQPRNLLELWRKPLMPWVCLLLVWGGVTLLWSNVERPADELARNVSIFLFLAAWQCGLGSDKHRIRQLLIGCAVIMVPIALWAIVRFAIRPPADERLVVGAGVMANANLAAGAMSAVLLWLFPWEFHQLKYRVAKWVALAVLGLLVLLTFARSAWAGLFAALIVMVLCRGGRRSLLYAGLIFLLGCLSVLLVMPMLTERGWSLRPEIFMQAKHLFLKHPWNGLGQGSEFQLQAGGETLIHAHNMFSQLAIELGLPGLLLWTGIWLALGWRGWCYRHETLGRIVLGLWVFATIMVQFDLPHLLSSPRPGWLITWLPLALSMSLGRRSADNTALTS